ncbi:uncharacterized protein H6S33_005942 [Morchella sextelata]|uniref:uncharacterized protein n=1 Tax=Morchella sextelata TaxID=1174677 RepID=UPI001D057E5F|nr:uncharacterized protein H6S33_005942 [Morchella sextelata]KAH0614056.1 hypothetical protein H6S33_005942 [Morchella sextelata]
MLFQRTFTQLSPLALIILGVQLVASHSWLQYLEIESTGAIGYPRNFFEPDPQADLHHVNLMESNKSLICNQFQRDAVNLPATPRLKASPGDTVIGWHRENGHTTDPVYSGKAGKTYWYGTSQPSKQTTLGDVKTWTRDGGPKGALVGTSKFDDGECAEPNHTKISKDRGVGVYGKNKNCRDSGFVVPKYLKAGTTYSLYWVWDYSDKYGPAADTGHFEHYSHCVDIDIVAEEGEPKVRRVRRFNGLSRARDLDSEA